MRSQTHKIIIIANLAILGAAAVSFLFIRSVIAQTATSSQVTATSTIEQGLSETASPPAGNALLTLDIPVSAPVQLREVHIIGTKYTDYFTDGTTTSEFPGDPAIHANIAKRDAPTPKRDGLTWDHSVGTYLYDTPSGDLEVGTFARQQNGTYLVHLATTTIANATSTPYLPARIVVMHEHPVTGKVSLTPAATPTAAVSKQPSAAEQTPTAADSTASAATAVTGVPASVNASTTADAGNSSLLTEGTSSASILPQTVGQVLGTSTAVGQPLRSDAPASTSSPPEQPSL